jgi:uncharacterized protein (TIGR02266 family)
MIDPHAPGPRAFAPVMLFCFAAACTQCTKQPSAAELELTYTVSGLIADWDINLSGGGTFIKMPDPLPVGTVVRLKLKAPEVVFPFYLEGRVVRTDRADAGLFNGMAVVFTDFDGEKRERLAQLVEALRHAKSE